MYNAIIMTVMYTLQNLMYAVTVNNDIVKSDQQLTKQMVGAVIQNTLVEKKEHLE